MLVSQLRYTPYGETRPDFAAGAFPTDRRCTGQREEVTLGVYDYGARRYDAGLGWFISADTVVPEGEVDGYKWYRQFQGLQYDRNMTRIYQWMNK